MSARQLTAEQLAALVAWRAAMGITWRAKLLAAWDRAGVGYSAYTPELQQIRNAFGPTWLSHFKMPATKNVAQRNASSFGRGPGGGVFSCRVCHRRTRATGRGDNEHVTLCVECFDLAGEFNSLSDNGHLYSVEGARESMSSLLAKGIDAVALFPEVAKALGIPAIDAPVISPALEAEIDTATVEILPATAAALLSSAIAEARAAVNPCRDMCGPAIAGRVWDGTVEHARVLNAAPTDGDVARMISMLDARAELSREPELGETAAAKELAAAAFTDLAPNCAGLTCAGCDDPRCVWYAAQMSGEAASRVALDVHAIARSLWNARPSDYLTNMAARNVWYATVSAFSDTIEAIHPGTNLSEFFDIAGVPS